MKKTIIILLLIFCSNILYGYQAEDIYLSNCKTYTNTTYIHQIFCKGDSIILATWGGVCIFNKHDSTFSTLVKSDGLVKNELQSVHYIQSIDELWFGSYLEGINRYKDGKFLKPYQENQGVEGDYINDIDDNNEFVFAGTDKGLIMFEIVDNETQFKKTFIAPRWLSDNNVNCITFDDSNRVWVGTNQGLDYAIINYDSMLVVTGWWHHININTTGYPFAEEKITCIDYYDGKIYFGTEDGFAIINKIYSDSLEFNEFTYSLPTRKISSILATDDSTVWVAFGKWNETNQRYDYAKGVGRYNLLNPDDSIVWDQDDSLFNQISDIKMDECGNIWVASWGNDIYQFGNDSTWCNYKRNCPGFNFFSTLMFDSNQRLWGGSGIIGGSAKGVKGISVYNNENWKTYNNSNSKLVGNKSLCMTEDLQGRIWIGDWNRGITRITNYEDTTEFWESITASPTCDVPGIIDENTISFITHDFVGNVWIGDYNTNIKIVVTDDTVYCFDAFIPSSHPNNGVQDPLSILILPDNIWFGAYYSGIRFWEGEGFPVTGQCQIANGNPAFEGPFMNIDIQRTDYGDYIWTGGIDGLYMYDDDWDDWYKFTCGLAENVRQYRWNGILWQPWIYYWYDEQGNPESRMGSGKTNQVNAVFVDPHGRKWIATNGGGISVLDADNYYFTNFNTENSDLCSDVVLSFAYNSYSGELFVGTSEGLCSFNIGASHKDTTQSHIVKKVNVFPNPFITSIQNKVYFESYPNEELPPGNNLLYIYNLAGELITTVKESDRFRFCWDGKNQANKPVASGIYFYVLSSEFDDVHITGKFAVIR